MKLYLVTAERLMLNNKVYHTDKLMIQAPSPEDAQAIVHNHFELHFEPRFRITEVKEVDVVFTGGGHGSAE